MIIVTDYSHRDLHTYRNTLTILRHVTLAFLIFRLLKNYDDIRIQHGRRLPVDFC